MRPSPTPLHRLVSQLAVCLLFTFSSALSQQDTLWYGHRAFGEGRYDDAMTAYQAAIDEGSTWDWLPYLIETVNTRKNLGTITPPDTHFIAAVFVTELQEITGSDTAFFPDVTPDQKAVWAVYFQVFRETLESFSGGLWTVSLDTVDATSTYQTDAALKPDNPDHLNTEEFFFGRMNEFDSFITFSNTRSPAAGLARQFPYINGVLYGPHRGMAAINAGSHGYGILLHEFFHVIEWVSNAISPTHGYLSENRHNFPAWTDSVEFDYYRWHFTNTLPQIGWQKLQHRTRWVPFNPRRQNFDSLQAFYGAIPLKDRHNADTLASEGMGLKQSDLMAAVDKWQQAVVLSPFHEDALLELHDYYRFTAGDSAAAAEHSAKLKLVRSVGDFFTLDSINSALGDVVALWHREDITTSWNFVRWNLDDFTQSGSYEVSFYYTHGFKALDIDSVSILENGAPVSLDAHIGFSGNAKTDITYSLMIPDHTPGATYELRAKVKGSGGIDSYGQIHLLRTGPATGLDSSKEGPGGFSLDQNFPNPFNPSTKISFTLHVSNPTSLNVYDMLGRKVYTIIDQRMNAGRHTVTWDAEGFPAGVYFYRLQSGEFSMTRRLLLLR